MPRTRVNYAREKCLERFGFGNSMLKARRCQHCLEPGRFSSRKSIDAILLGRCRQLAVAIENLHADRVLPVFRNPVRRILATDAQLVANARTGGG